MSSIAFLDLLIQASQGYLPTYRGYTRRHDSVKKCTFIGSLASKVRYLRSLM